MDDIKEFLSLDKCDCGRSWCDYFAPGVGEYGVSYSKEDVKEMLEDAKKLEKHLEKIL